MGYAYDVMYAALYVCVNCFVVGGCVLLMMYTNVCNSDVFSVINMYLDYSKFCVVCINDRRYVCGSECSVVSNKCDESPPLTYATYRCARW